MDIRQKAVNTLRLLSLDQIERANSGHPGIALGSAPILFTLYNSVMNYDYKDPKYINRDRFVLSAGHGSALLYSTLHMFGFNITKDDLMNFRQINSVTPGHPEYDLSRGIETSTGPLGQGISNAVGMAIAEKHMASIFNKPDYEIFNNNIYCLAGDGCLMEGISNEALSLAGTLCLDNLILIYDSNKISLEGSTELSFTEDTKSKFEALGFNVLNVEDVNNLDELESVLNEAKNLKGKPKLVIVNTQIGYGSDLVGSEKVHGTPLSKEQIERVKRNLSFEHNSFEISDEVAKFIAKSQKNSEKSVQNWQKLLKNYEKEHFEAYKELQRFLNYSYNSVAVDFLKTLKIDETLSMRDMAHTALKNLKLSLPNLIGGSADVAPSTKAFIENGGSYSKNDYSGKNIHFGVREHAMAGIINGIYLYGGLRSFGSTYMAFTDYMKGAMRLSALMSLPIIYYITHDSVLIGQDGPTHEPVEQLISLRAMPNMNVFRPCNSKEVLASFITGIESSNPTTIVLSKSKIKAVERSVEDALKGGYVLSKENKTLELIIIATGSEVELALQAKTELEALEIGVRVVSLPCFELFDKQDAAYKNSVLPKNVTNRIAVEAGSDYSFYKYVGSEGKILGVTTFGYSGKEQDVAKKMGLTTEHIVKMAKSMLKIK
ncbi:MAG: transketolase [Spirochaetales bacterium]